ncbi:MAG: hypothetical protein IAF02_19685 [Anaerolineae bacterium]|nr:hypothetical protein [Anaerolineae bacterium]
MTQNRGFSRDNIFWLNYYRDIDHGQEGIYPGITKFLYDVWNNSSEENLTDEDKLKIENKLKWADWIIFAFAAGDCGPDSYKVTTGDRCGRGNSEADTLHWFLDYITNKDYIDAKVVAISYGSPPWSLDTTDIGQLDAYYAAFNQLEPFEIHSIRALLREFEPTGASPITAMGTEYNLENALEPDPNQILEIQITSELTKTSLTVGDIIDVKISELVDKNGNDVLYMPNVRWRSKNNSSNMEMLPLYGDTKIVNGQANATFQFNEPGIIEIRAFVKGLESEVLTLEIFEPPTITPTITSIPSPTKTATYAPATPSVTPIANPTIDKISPFTNGLVPPSALNNNSNQDEYLQIIVSIIVIIFFGFIIIGVFFFFKRHSHKNNVIFGEDSNSRKEIFDNLVTYFTKEEFKTLCFDLGVNYDTLDGTGFNTKARELIIYLENRNRVQELITKIKTERPNSTWKEN